MRTKKHYCAPLITAALLAIVAVSPHAQADNSWDGGGGNGNWNTPANWGLDTLPSTGVLLSFGGNLQPVTTNDLAAGLSYAGLSFTNDGGVGKTSAFTLSGSNVVITADVATTSVTGTPITDTISLNVQMSGNRAFSVGTNHHLLISGLISQATSNRQLTKSGDGTLTLQSAGNSFSGSVNINGATITVDSSVGIANAGVNSALGLGNGSGAVIKLGNASATGTLNFASGAASTDRQVVIGNNTATATGGGAINNNTANGSGTLAFTNAAFNVSAGAITTNRVLTLGGTNTDANEIRGTITDNNTVGGGTIGVSKAGIGRWILSGSNTFTGNTTVSAGTLIVSSTGSIAAGSAAPVTVQSGAAIGGDGAILGSLTLGNGAKLVFDLNGVGLTVGGTFSLDSSFGITNLVSPTLAAIDWSTVSFGTYTLVNTTTVFNAGNIQNFGISNALFSGGKQMYFENGSLNLVVAVPEPSTLALAGLGLAGVLILGRRSRS